MVELNQEAATRAKDAMNLAQHSAVLLVVEVAIGGEPAHNRVEVVNPWKCPHVTRHVLNRNSPDSSVGARPLQKHRRHVESGDAAHRDQRACSRFARVRTRGRALQHPARRLGVPTRALPRGHSPRRPTGDRGSPGSPGRTGHPEAIHRASRDSRRGAVGAAPGISKLPQPPGRGHSKRGKRCLTRH